MRLDQHVLLGADEGLYTLNLNEIHENSMELVSHRASSLVMLDSCCYWSNFHINPLDPRAPSSARRSPPCSAQ